MKKIFLLIFVVSLLQAKGGNMSVYDFTVKTISGEERSLSYYKGKVLLIVNVASQCGFTPQYDGLQDLYDTYKDQGFEVLGFPCNQFGSQEPGSEEEIKSFCTTNFHITFDMFSKIDVNGKNEHPLYTYLKSSQGGFVTDAIKWNFTKFLVDKEGKVVDRFSSATKPKALKSHIEELLGS